MLSINSTRKFLHFCLARDIVPISMKVGTVILATMAIYYQDFFAVGNEAIRSELMSHVIAIPFLLAYLIYRKRKMLRAVIPSKALTPIEKTVSIHEIVGAMLCFLAFLLYWHGSYTLYPLEYHIVSLPLFVAGLVLLMFNVQTLKVLAFPIAFLLFLIPLPYEFVYATGATWATYALEVVYVILKATGLPVSLITQYGSPVLILNRSEALPLTFAVETLFASIHPLTVFTVFATFVAFIARGPAWKKGVVFLAGFPLIFVLNIMRITIMMLIGCQYGTEVSMGTAHIFVNWFLIFVGTFFFLLYISEKILKTQIFATKSKPAPCLNCSQGPERKQNFCLVCGKLLRYIDIKLSKRDLFKIAALTISVSLTTLLEVPAFTLRNGNIQVITQLRSGEKINTPVLPEVTGYTLRFGYSNETLEKIVGSNVSLTYVYTPADESKTMIWGTIEIADSASVFQRQETYTLQLLQGEILDFKDAQLLSRPPIFGRFVSLRSPESNLALVVLYWYERAIFDTGSSAVEKYVKISIFTFTSNPSDYVRIEENLLPVGQAIASHWELPRAWSWIASLVAQYGYALSIIVMVLLAVILTVQAIDLKMRKKRNLKAFSKLALEDEKTLLQAIHQAGRRGKATANAIALSFNNLAQKPIEQNWLLDTLKCAEEAGLVTRSIANEKDEPTLVWKSQIAFPGSKSYFQRIRKLIGLDRILARFGYQSHRKGNRNT